MQDAMRAVFDVWPEVTNKVYADEQQFYMSANMAEETSEAARKVYAELKTQMGMRRLKLSLDEEGKEGKRRVPYTSK